LEVLLDNNGSFTSYFSHGSDGHILQDYRMKFHIILIIVSALS
jgi:hypothetical protein